MSNDGRKTGNKGYDIRDISDHQLEACRRIALGQDPALIAEDLNLTTQSVSNYRNHPVLKEIIAAFHQKRDITTANIAQQIAEVAPKALELMSRIITFDAAKATNDDLTSLNGVPDLKDKIAVSMGILKIAAPRFNFHAHARITSSDIEEMKRRALEGSTPEEVPYEDVA